MGPGDLRDMLGALPSRGEPRVLVDASTSDDAGVVRLEGKHALIHTVDVITPIVDDPAAFGRIAAANAVSDVYAMGGTPTSAVALLGVPKGLPPSALKRLLGAAEQLLHETGAPLIGGHTVKDQELKLGFAVTGKVDPRRMVTNARARPGDRLVLTKRLGTGVLYQAMKAGLRKPAETRALVRSMCTLNARAAETMLRAGVRAGTDVTGFGLLGHALNLARASGVDLWLEARALPALPGVEGYLERGVFPGTVEVNLRGYGGQVVREAGVPDAALRLAADPQTSGGLLMCVPARRVGQVLSALDEAWVVGEVRARAGARPAVRLVAEGAPTPVRTRSRH